MQQGKTIDKPKPHFSRRELAVLAILFSASLVVGTGIQMGNVLFPSLSRLLNVPVGTVTLLASVWAFTGLLSPLFGLASDRYGHGAFAVIGLGSFVLGNLLCAVAPNFPALLVFQIPIGLGYAVFSFSSSAVIGDVFAYEVRGRAMGLVRVAVSVVALAGVPVAAVIAERGTARASFATVGGLGLIVLVIMLALLPRLSHPAARFQPDEARRDFGRTITGIIRQRSTATGLLAILGWAAIPTGVFIYLAAWLEQAFKLTESEIGLAFSMIGVGALIGNALTATLADRLGKKRSSVLGLLVLSATTMLLSRSLVLPIALAGLVVFTAALEFSFGSFITLLTELSPESRGMMMSLVSLVNGIGTGIVPLAMRPLWESRGYAPITLVLGAVGLSVAIIIGLFVSEPEASTVASSQGNR